MVFDPDTSGLQLTLIEVQAKRGFRYVNVEALSSYNVEDIFVTVVAIECFENVFEWYLATRVAR